MLKHRHVTHSLFCYLSRQNWDTTLSAKQLRESTLTGKDFQDGEHRAIISSIKDGYERKAILVAALAGLFLIYGGSRL